MEKYYLNFSIFNGEMEVIDEIYKGRKCVEDEVSESDLDGFVEELKKVEGFMVSDLRTQIRMSMYENTMDIVFDYHIEPEDGEFEKFDTYELKGIPIPPEMNLDKIIFWGPD